MNTFIEVLKFFVLFSLLLFFLFGYNHVQAKTIQKTLIVTATVICPCNVRGNIIPITQGVCQTECDKLNKEYEKLESGMIYY